MLRIGYVRLRDPRAADDDAAALRGLGCHVVRTEADGACATLTSILDFIGAGDQLVAARLEQLSGSAREVLEVLDRLHARGASLEIIEPELCSQGDGGRALRAALQAVAGVQLATPPRRGPAATQDIRALQKAGLGPVEIARRLGVSRMTVWRKLKAFGAQTAA